MNPRKLAFSYMRFSTKKQEHGDSLRRQTKLRDDYLARHSEWALDDTLKPDAGVSAWKGKNATHGELRIFMEMIAAKKIQPGDALIVESVDRISRQGIDVGYDLLKKILKAGVHIITLSPERNFGPDAITGLGKGAFELQMILERAAEESEIKSQRCGAAWRRKKEGARTGLIVTERLPFWVKLGPDGKLELIPEKAKVVKRIFKLAANGYGTPRIIKKLNEDKVPTIGKTGLWVKGYVGMILRDRRAIGEYQPRTGKKRVPDGEPVAKYFPAAVDEKLFLRARSGASKRGKLRGRIGTSQINIFAGLLHNARPEGGAYYLSHRTNHTKDKTEVKKHYVLITRHSQEGMSPAWSFPYPQFEGSLLSAISEIDAKEVMGEDPNTEDLEALEGRKAQLEKKIAAAEKEQLAGKDWSPSHSRILAAMNKQWEEIENLIGQARQSAALPLRESWEEGRCLVTLLNNAEDKDDIRMKLRSVFRRTIEGIWVIVTTKNKLRVCTVQMWFTGGTKYRFFQIVHQPPMDGFGGKKEEDTFVVSFSHKDGDFDMRTAKGQKFIMQRIEKQMEEL